MHHQPQSQSSSGNNQFHGSRPFQPSPFTPLVLNSTTNTAAATMNHTVAPVLIIQQPLTGEQWKALPWIDRLKSQVRLLFISLLCFLLIMSRAYSHV